MNLPIIELERMAICDLRSMAASHSGYIFRLAASIEVDGLQEPLVIGNGYLLEGHHRLLALKQLGYTEAPVISADAH